MLNKTSPNSVLLPTDESTKQARAADQIEPKPDFMLT